MNKEINEPVSNEDYILRHYGFYKMSKEYHDLKTIEQRRDYMKHMTEWYMKQKAALSYEDSK
jgi:hypothetical protein